MADPMMDLFDDPNLFGLDSLTSDSFTRDGPDTIDEALGLGNVLEQFVTDRGPEQAILHVNQRIQPRVLPENRAPILAPEPVLPAQPTINQEPMNQGNPFMGTPLTVTTATTTTAAPTAPKIMILKAPPGMTVGGVPVTQIQTLTPGQTANGGKVTIAKVLTGTQLRPGVSIVSGNTVLAKVPSQAGHAGVRPVRQLLLQPMRTSATDGNTSIKPAVTLTSTPQQVE